MVGRGAAVRPGGDSVESQVMIGRLRNRYNFGLMKPRGLPFTWLARAMKTDQVGPQVLSSPTAISCPLLTIRNAVWGLGSPYKVGGTAGSRRAPGGGALRGVCPTGPVAAGPG